MQRNRDTLIPADENRAMFDRIARFYDGTNRILSLGLDRYWRRKALDRLDIQAGGRYLDVGAGTADVAIAIVRREPTARVVGLDPSVGMLSIGREKIAGLGLSDAVTLIPGDALDLPFPDSTFDGVIIAFCIRNVTDRRRALREFRRVLTPGGRLVILELTDPVGRLMRPLFRIYSNVVMPAITKVTSSASAYRYLTDSMMDFPPAERFSGIVGEAGFTNASFTRLTGGIVTIFRAEVSQIP